MENNEQNNFEATNDVNPVNNVGPTNEVKTEDTIMVAEPAARPAVEPTPAPVAPASQPMPAPEVSSRPESVVETTPVQPTVEPEPVVETTQVEPTVEPEPVVIPKGEKPKKNNGLVALLLILILIVLAVCGYFVYDKYVKDLITKPSANETSGNQANNVPEPTPNVEPTNDESNSINASDNENKESVLNPEEGIYEKMPIGDASIGENIIIKNIRNTTEDRHFDRMNPTSYMVTIDTHTFDVYLDDKLIVKDFEITSYPQEKSSYQEYKGTYLEKVGVMNDTDTDAIYLAFSVGSYTKKTLYIIDKDGSIYFEKENIGGKGVPSFALKGTTERFTSITYKFDKIYNSEKYRNEDVVLNYSCSSTDGVGAKGIVNAVKISSGKANEFVYMTYNSDQIDILGA